MDNSINTSEKTALPALPDFNLITTEKIVVLSTSTIKKDKMIVLIINVEWTRALTSELRDVEMIFPYIFFDDNDQIFAIFVENKYEKPLGIQINFFFYQNANYIYYLIIKFEINYEENRIIKRKLIDFRFYRNYFPLVNEIEYHVINF
jgi:hypothetical protein